MKPDWGKPTVRNFREEDGNGSYRAILLPERRNLISANAGDPAADRAPAFEMHGRFRKCAAAARVRVGSAAPGPAC